MEDRSKTNTLQNIYLENREKISISGVLDVYSFDDKIIIIETELGLLTLKGDNLKITKLSLDTSDFIVEGLINNLSYSNNEPGSKNTNGILSKIFK